MTERIANEELVAQYKMLKEQNDIYGASKAIEQLIANNQGIINERIRRLTIYRDGLNEDDMDDLKGASLEAIWQTAEAFDTSKNVAFITYAVWKIDSQILDWLRGNRLIHISNEMQSLCAKYMEIVGNYQVENNGRMPSDEYIAKLLGVGKKTFLMIKDALAVFHINAMYTDADNENEEEDEIEQIPKDSDDYMDIIIRENHETFARIILCLRNEKERKVIFEYFYKERKFRDIAKELSVTEQRVNTIKNKALKHLRQMPEVINIARETGILRTK